MLAYYSDFRIDNPEAGTSSTGPLGGGPAGGAVTGIGANQRNLAGYCTQGRFQWQFIQPVYVGANQMQQYPPDGSQGNEHAQRRGLFAATRRADAQTEKFLRTTTRCRKSAMRWAIAGRPSSRPK